MGEKCQICKGEGDIPVKVNLCFDKFERVHKVISKKININTKLKNPS